MEDAESDVLAGQLQAKRLALEEQLRLLDEEEKCEKVRITSNSSPLRCPTILAGAAIRTDTGKGSERVNAEAGPSRLPTPVSGPSLHPNPAVDTLSSFTSYKRHTAQSPSYSHLYGYGVSEQNRAAARHVSRSVPSKTCPLLAHKPEVAGSTPYLTIEADSASRRSIQNTRPVPATYPPL